LEETAKPKKVGISSLIHFETAEKIILGEVNLVAKTIETMFQALRNYEIENKVLLGKITIDSTIEEDYIRYKISARG
jgi:hypothetical protein